ncbi:MAG TPA: hypothetical protein VFU21_20645, partial [Kofleriaceae bacterium]|nr:hypothetical protein [Kofleriaceae bacterium]
KSYLQDEYDTKNAKEDIAKEVMTGLVTMGTSFFAAGLLSTVGKGARLFQQAGAARQVLQKPPSIWSVFLREASEEVASEGMDNVVEAHLEATNPEHWVDGFKVGAKRARAASDAVLARADDDMFAAAVTSLVTAGVGKLKKGKGRPEFEKPSSGRKREVNLKRNLKMVFGDPEEKFTAAGIEWLMAQSQNGSIDWDNAPEELLKGLLEEYKESVHEVHGHYAHQGRKASKVDRHLAKHGSHLQNQTEVDLFKEVNQNAGDTDPFVTAHDFARIRTEVAVAGLQAHEAAHGSLTNLQRDAFIQWVRKAPNTEELHRRAKSNPLEVDDVKYADARAKPNTAIGKPIASEETARQVMRELADGKKEALAKLGLAVPPDFDPTKNEWGLGKHTDVATGEVSYILIRGDKREVDWAGFPGVEAIAHSHPDLGPTGRESNHLTQVDQQGGVDVRTLCTTDGPDRIHFLPSGADLVFVLRRGIKEHTVYTAFQSLGGRRVGNPTPGSNNAGINIVIKNPEPAGFMFGNPDSPVAKVQIEIWAGGQMIDSMTLWGSDHLGGSHLWHQTPPAEQVGPPDHEAFGGGDPAAPRRRTPSGQRDGDGPVPSDVHSRPTIQVPAQPDPSQRPTIQVPAQPDPSQRRTEQHPAVDPNDRPTGQFPAVDPSQIGPAPDMPGMVEPVPSGNRPARREAQQRVINRSAVTVFDELPQLAELESAPGEVMASGGHVMRRAQHALQAMSDQDYLGFKALLASQPSPVARAFLFKAAAAGNTMDDIYWLSDEISMQDDAWMIDNLTLGDPRQAGGGLTQQWSTSCNAATTLMVRGNYDPVFALRFRQANGTGALGAHQAQLEQQMLESQYSGNWQNVPPQGHAVPHGAPGGIGRAADDLLNQQSAQTGLEFTPHVPGSQADAVATIDDRLRDGMQVPVILGNDRIGFMHYVLAMQRRETAAGVEFQIHDPGGETRWIAAADIAAGRADLFGYTKISGLDLPSDINSPADVTTAEGGAPGSRRRDDQNDQTQNQDLSEGEKTEKQEQKGRGLPTFAVKLSDLIRDVEVIDPKDDPKYFGVEFWITLPNGRKHSLGFGGIDRDVRTGEPTGDPSFSLDASLTLGGTEYAVKLFDDVVAGADGRPVGSGEHTPLTKLALLQFVAAYKKKFGRDPESLGGSLAFHNKLFFQQEFFKNREKGMTTDDAALAAVKAISYGQHRADDDVGYGDFEVFIDRTSYEDVALGKDKNGRDLGTQNVPT